MFSSTEKLCYFTFVVGQEIINLLIVFPEEEFSFKKYVLKLFVNTRIQVEIFNLELQ